MPRRRARGNVDFHRLRTLRGNLSVGVGNADMWQKITSMTPLGYRASFLAYFKFPSSFASYMYGVSPALMSQNNYKEEVERGMSRQSGYSPLSHDQMEKAWKALAQMYYDNTANPNRDIPSRIRRQEGVSQYTINGFKDYVDRLALTASDTGPWRVADAPLAETMPVEGVSVSVDGDGNITTHSEGVDIAEHMDSETELQEEEVVDEVEITESLTELDRNVVIALYRRYQNYVFTMFGYSTSDEYFEAVTQPNYLTNRGLKNTTITLLTLEKLGFYTLKIDEVLRAFAEKNLILGTSKLGSAGGYGPYIVLNLQGKEGANVQAYQSRASWEIVERFSGSEKLNNVKTQFSSSHRELGFRRAALQPFRFSGMRRGGDSVRGVQVVSLKFINDNLVTNSDNAYGGWRTWYSEKDTESKSLLARVNARQRGASVTAPSPSTTDTSGPTGENPTLYLIGYQQFMPRQTFRSRSELITAGGMDGENKSWVFYFVAIGEDNRISQRGWYRSVFGEASLLVSSMRVTSAMKLSQLKDEWNQSGNLDETNVLKVSPVPSPDLNQLRQAVQQVIVTSEGATDLPTLSQFTFKPTRPSNSDHYNTIPFNDVERRLNSVGIALRENVGQNEIVLGANQQGGAASSSEQGLTTQQLKTVQQQPFRRGFGVEIEGNFDEANRHAVARLLTEKGFPTKSTGYHGSAPRGYFKLEVDSSVDNDLRSGGGTFEMVSPVLKGEAGITKLSGVLEVIRSQGARTSPSAGTHIHFGYADFGDGEAGFEKRKRLIVNFCVLQPFFESTQILQARNRGYAERLKLTSAKIKKLADSPDYTTLRNRWSDVGGGRGALHLKEGYNMTAGAVPTYEFRFPASNFETDTITNMVRLIEKVWSASIDGYLPHSVESSKPKQAEEWLEDLLGQQLFSFWKNRYRDLQGVEDYKVDDEYPRRSDVRNDSGDTIVSNKLLPTLNSW